MPARLNYGPRLSEEKKVRQSIERAWERGEKEGGESEEGQTESGTKKALNQGSLAPSKTRGQSAEGRGEERF